MTSHVGIISFALAVLIVAVPVIAIIGRVLQGKGIGWQFIRFTTIVVALPIAGILALNDAMGDGVLALLAGALGYAFGKSGEGDT